MSNALDTEAADVSRRLEETELAQRRASSPEHGAWVSANAGAGKTHVLKMRVLRLLLSGVAPARILCLTYTKAAAAEMSSRIFEALAGWTIADDTRLSNDILLIVGREPDSAGLARARQLFAQAIETPGGLKIQTIHAFAERLLQRFPLEAGTPPGFKIIDEAADRKLLGDALDETLRAMAGDAIGRGADSAGAARHSADALATIVRYAGEERFREVVTEAIRQRDWIDALDRLAQHAPDGGSDVDVIDLYYRSQLGLGRDDTSAALTLAIADSLTPSDLAGLADVLDGGSSSDRERAVDLRKAGTAATPERRAEAVLAALLTKDMEPRKSITTKKIREDHPHVADVLERTRDRVHDLVLKRAAAETLEATGALIHVAMAAAARYREAKRATAGLDFDDLIAHVVALIATSSDAQWVLYKLDGGIDHILVDEAQDTSGAQWRIVRGLASEFFENVDDQERPRTVFAVGDEKQSIYSFQGAAPERFAAEGTAFRNRAQAVGLSLPAVPLTVSFRTVQPILASVDAVMGQGLDGVGTSGPVHHEAIRLGQAGCVEVWPLTAAEDHDETHAFDPLGAQQTTSAHRLLAERIARTIGHWITSGRRLEAEDRPIRAGDVLILLRKRTHMAAPLTAALKRHGVPVAGADRLKLMEELCVQDLVALAEFLVLPEDDLALANVLKSPLFDFDDDDLMRLAPERSGSLWWRMIRSAEHSARDADVVGVLRRWRAAADYLPPYEFFAVLLASESLELGLTYRGRILQRLGPDAIEPLDDFLERALSFDDQAAPSLQGFVAWLRADPHEIKRDMDGGRDEVRIMTVHGAKGLEAPIVVLADTAGAPERQRTDALVDIAAVDAVRDPDGDDSGDADQTLPARVWAIPPAKHVPAVKAARAAEKADTIAEANRLLYVAMTRARDELYVTGVAPASNRKLPDTSWYAIISNGLDGQLAPATDAFGDAVLRIASPQTAEPRPSRAGGRNAIVPLTPPEWARQRARTETRNQIPIAPSRISPLEVDAVGDPQDAPPPTVGDGSDQAGRAQPGHDPRPGIRDAPPARPPRERSADHRFLRGTITHALLQHLPDIAPEARQRAADAFVSLKAAALSPAHRARVITESLAVLSDPQFADAFGPGSRAEVPIVAEIPAPDGRAPPLRITGQIDRLVVRTTDVLILDFKTNRPPPWSLADVPLGYIAQLAAYRLAVSAIFDGKAVTAALLWTDGARLMPIPDEMLNAAERELWTAEAGHLDGV